MPKVQRVKAVLMDCLNCSLNFGAAALTMVRAIVILKTKFKSLFKVR